MTIGSQVVDLRALVPVGLEPNPSRTALAGLYSSKTWNGQDWPAAYPVHEENTWTNPHFYTEFYYDPERASMRRRKVQSPRKEIEHRTRWVKHPQRFYREEHNYDCQFMRYNSTPYRELDTRFNEWTAAVLDGGMAQYPADPWTALHQLKLLGKLRTRIVGNSFNAGLAAVELDKTFMMMGQAIHRLARGIHHASRGNFSAATRVLVGNREKAWHKTKPLARNWLELQYGWMPLYSDVYGGAQFLAHHFNVPLQETYRVSVRANGPPVVSASPSTVGFSNSYNWTRKTLKVIVKEKNVWILSGLLDPMSMAWERLPFSFVFDWFLPIDQWLSARQLNNGLDGTFVESTLRKVRATDPKNLIPWMRWVGPVGWFYERGYAKRTVSSSANIPYLEDMNPLRKVASKLHVANSLALLSQLDRKMFSRVYR
nr:MAG: hypothetical protein 1 [Leviviridae sp.]